MNREAMLLRAREQRSPWDFVVIGGGATGAGVAVDAATRGYSVLLLERGDFGIGTSSRSTKLVHGGVRYLRQGNISLVLEALNERGRLRRNAPHIVHDREFVLPCYRRWDLLQYGIGLKAYDLLAGRWRFGRSRIVSAAEVIRRLPTIRTEGLRGGVVYHDGQFDDARLLIHLLMTAADRGACVLNYAPVTGITRSSDGAVNGVQVRDSENNIEFQAAARVVVNAAGPFCDDVRRLANWAAEPMLAASQGSHVVLDQSFLPGNSALLIPETPDGRVLFAIPWHGHTLLGTTDIAVPSPPVEPRATEDEIAFILETAGRYLARQPRREDVLSTFAGIRPLVKSGGNTASMSRDHTLRVDAPGLLTITGGKWTTYRSMAEGCVDKAAAMAPLPRRRCVTANLRLHGAEARSNPPPGTLRVPTSPTAEMRTRPAAFSFPEPGEVSSSPPPLWGRSLCQRQNGWGESDPLTVYGSDASAIQSLIHDEPALGLPLHPALPYCGAEVVWAVRAEMARTVADVLARRTRALVLKAAAAREMAPRVAELMALELGRDHDWIAEQVRAFHALATNTSATS